MIRTLIADDHPVLRAGLKHILAESGDVHLVGEVADGNELMAHLATNEYDIVVLDMVMPGLCGVELIKALTTAKPFLPILVLSTHKEDLYAVRAIRAGASGYLCKDNAANCLVDAIRKVAAGGKWVTPSVVAQLTHEADDVTRHSLLSNRELEVFLLILAGKSVTEIAERLTLSVKTISTHKVRIKAKLGLASVSEWVCYALNHGLMQEQI